MIRYSLLALITLVPQIGTAQTLSCGATIINEGVTKAVVLAKCGTPTQAGDRTGAEAPAIGEVTPPSSGDEVWTYNFGPSKLMQRIWFQDGVVTRVESLGYGH
jgi:Protein of unknown function (DUF2845)